MVIGNYLVTLLRLIKTEMKFRYIYITIAFAFALSVNARNRTIAEMEDIARLAMTHGNTSKAKAADGDLELTLVDANRQLGIFSAKGSGFVIVNRNDQGRAILAQSSNDYAPDMMPEAYKWWLETTIRNLESGYTLTTDADQLKSATTIDNFILTTWGQGAPYNAKCPTVTRKNGSGKASTGCVATALAQVMNHYRYPERGKGTGGYYVVNTTATKSDTLYYEESINNTYQWDKLKTSYTIDETDTEPISTLLFDVGKATYMTYEAGGSGASLFWMTRGMVENFSYDSLAINYYVRSYFTDAEWYAMIRNEIEAGRPVAYAGQTSKKEGHAFLFTGIDTEGKVYVNWGWDSHYDGWFAIDQLVPMQGDDFNYGHHMIVGFNPQPDPSPGEENTSLMYYNDESYDFKIVSTGSDVRIRPVVYYNFSWRYFFGQYRLMIENEDTGMSYALLLPKLSIARSAALSTYEGIKVTFDSSIKAMYKSATGNELSEGHYKVWMECKSDEASQWNKLRRMSDLTFYSYFLIDANGTIKVSNTESTTSVKAARRNAASSPSTVYTIKGVSVGTDFEVLPAGVYIKEGKTTMK